MASSTVMPSSTTRNSDLRRLHPASASTKSLSISEQERLAENNAKDSSSSNLGAMTVDGLFQNVRSEDQVGESMLIDAQITLLDAAGAVTAIGDNEISHCSGGKTPTIREKTVDDVWKEIVAGRFECKEEAPDEMMTLEDFLVKAGAAEEEDVTPATERLSGGLFPFHAMPLNQFQSRQSINGGRGKRRAVFEPLDKAAQQRQRRMIKNREAAARSRERKQAYQVELEALAVRLEEENQKLLKEKEERTRRRLKQLMELVVPVAEKRRPPSVLRRVRSTLW